MTVKEIVEDSAQLYTLQERAKELTRVSDELSIGNHNHIEMINFYGLRIEIKVPQMIQVVDTEWNTLVAEIERIQSKYAGFIEIEDMK
jgi:hypothetical protein